MSKIKLEIEIDEEIYKEAIRSGYSHLYDEDVANAVAAGTPITASTRYNIDTLRVKRSYPAALILYSNEHIIKDAVKRDLANDLVSQMYKYITIETYFDPRMDHYNFFADVKVVRAESEDI